MRHVRELQDHLALPLEENGLRVTVLGGNVDPRILSQVVLSMQLSFAVIPLVMFTSDKRKMGEFVNAPWLKALAWTTAAVIAVLNLWLLWATLK